MRDDKVLSDFEKKNQIEPFCLHLLKYKYQDVHPGFLYLVSHG